MNWFEARKQQLFGLKNRREDPRTPDFSDAADLPAPCPQCGALITKKALSENLYVCPSCGYHHPIGAYHRLHLLLDPGTFRELSKTAVGQNLLGFPGYEDKLAENRKKTALREAVVTATGRVGGQGAVLAVLDGRFLMGSMGAAVGEKVARAAEYAANRNLPLIVFSASGGARMQEGVISLMQMAKTAAAVGELDAKGGLFISVLTHPTTGGVSASFAFLGDIILAEPGALIGFAGPRVIEQTIKEKLPEGFQRAEFVEQHGFLDAVVPRSALRDTLAKLLQFHKKGGLLPWM